MRVLDTDTLSLLQRGHEKVAARAREAGASELLAITQITYFEQLLGRMQAVLAASDGPDLVRAVERLGQTITSLNKMHMLLVEGGVPTQFDRLKSDKRFRRRGNADLLIASIVLAQDQAATLVTRNTKDFAGIPGLKLENWAD